MEMYQIVALGIVSAVLALTLKKQDQMFALLISIAAAVVIFVMILPHISSVLEVLRGIAARVQTSVPYADVMIKIIGIAYMAEFGAQLCADAGESAIAGKIELAGKILILTVSSPIILALLEQVVSML